MVNWSICKKKTRKFFISDKNPYFNMLSKRLCFYSFSVWHYTFTQNSSWIIKKNDEPFLFLHLHFLLTVSMALWSFVTFGVLGDGAKSSSIPVVTFCRCPGRDSPHRVFHIIKTQRPKVENHRLQLKLKKGYRIKKKR